MANDPTTSTATRMGRTIQAGALPTSDHRADNASGEDDDADPAVDGEGWALR